MSNRGCAIWMAGMGLAMVALIAHGQDASKAALVPPGASPAETLFIVHLTTGPGWNKDKPAHEQPGFTEHSQNLSRMRTEGMLVVGARYRDSVADKGMLIMRAENAGAVSAQFAADPMVKDKLFVLDIAGFQPFYDGFIARPAPATRLQDSPLNSLSWLAGCWLGHRGKTEFREHWMQPAGGLMLGMGRTTVDGKIQSFEAMRIELDASGAPVFVAKPSGQSEANFRMVKVDVTSVVFENPTHDFPQRVIYQVKSDGTLAARIEGTRKGREARIDYPMRRANCG